MSQSPPAVHSESSQSLPLTPEAILGTVLELAQQYPVLPCRANKQPLTSHGYKDATQDIAQIKAWWQQWPYAIAGVPTGAVSGLLVLDIDRHPGKDGYLTLEQNGWTLPPTRRHATPSGGEHVLFRYEGAESLRCSTGQLGAGLDIRTTGGLIVWWPANGRPVLEAAPLAAVPQWLIDNATRKQNAPSTNVEASGPIPEGQRNSTLASMAGTMRRRDMSEAAIAAALLAENAARCTPPLPEDEVQKTAQSVARYAPSEVAHEASPPTTPPQPPLEAYADYAGTVAPPETKAEAPPPPDTQGHTTALHTVTEAVTKAEGTGGDCGAPFETPVLNAWRLLKQHHRADYIRLMARAAKCDGVSKVDLREAIGGNGGDGADTKGSGTAITLYVPEPWPKAVDGAGLLDEVLAAIKRHVFLPEASAIAVALWVAHQHCFDVFSHTPRLLITAPLAECGKTLLLSHLVGGMVTRPMPTELMSPAPFFRLTELYKPCWLADECDVFVRADADLLAGINAGWEPQGQVIRCVGDDNEPRGFSTYAPVAMAGVKLHEKLPATTLTRSVVVYLERATPDEVPERYNSKVHHPQLRELGRKLARWVADNRDAIASHQPTMPVGVYNRLHDKWAPLFTMAQVVGGKWPALVSEALKGQQDMSTPAREVQLLIDIKAVWPQGADKLPADKLPTDELLSLLASIPESPYANWNFKERYPEDRRINSMQLARLLKPYSVKPKLLRAGGGPLRGYEHEELKRAFNRYIPPTVPVTPLQTSNDGASSHFVPVTEKKGVTGSASLKPAPDVACNTVTGSSTPTIERTANVPARELLDECQQFFSEASPTVPATPTTEKTEAMPATDKDDALVKAIRLHANILAVDKADKTARVQYPGGRTTWLSWRELSVPSATAIKWGITK